MAIWGVFERFFDNFGIGHVIALLALTIFTGWAIMKQRADVVILLMICTSLLTTAGNAGVATGAFVARWYFLGIAAIIALMRLGRPNPLIASFMILWVLANIFGMVYTPGVALERAGIRAMFYLLALPACIYAMSPPTMDLKQLRQIIINLAILGVIMSGLHFVFVLIAPQGGGVSRFGSFYASTQGMSIATGMVTLPIVWVLMSKAAGKWYPIFLGALLVNLTVMIASAQRTAMFTLVGAVVIMLAFYRKRGALLAILGVGGIGLVAMPVITYLASGKYLAERFTSVDPAGRSDIWAWALMAAMKSPLIGHGSGSGASIATELFGKKFHEAYLQTLYDLGFAGILVFVGMIVVGAVIAFRVTWSKNEKVQSIGVFCFCAIAMVAAQGLAETGLADTANPTAMMMFVTLGLASGASIFMKEPSDERPQLNTDFTIPIEAAHRGDIGLPMGRPRGHQPKYAHIPPPSGR